MLVAYASGHEDDAGDGGARCSGELDVGPAALFSTLGRTAARGMETVLLAGGCSVWYDQLVDRIKSGDTADVQRRRSGSRRPGPPRRQGYGYLDAPRGALGHWVQIENGKISRYQCVVPSTWNCSPRDAQGRRWARTRRRWWTTIRCVDPEQPLEILRTIHSFDPCMACGVHVLDADGQPGRRR